MTKLAHKKHLQEVLSLSSGQMKKVHKVSSTLEIVFSSFNLERAILGHDDPMIISAAMVNAEVKRVFADQGSLVDIIFRDAFSKLGLKNSNLQSYKKELIGFSGEKVYLNGYVTLHLTLGTRPRTRIVKVDFLVVDSPSAYNVILERPTLNKIRVIISTAYLTMKFFTEYGAIMTVKIDQAVGRRCYNVSLAMQRKTKMDQEVVNGL